ncbi:MAG: TIGR04211 family SH3 domain-containing protein [Gammaproteobacteria bacterium]|nr:TIGR04211 family SH3 domain-containing protein [Gammaproteobacteria bacterium]NND53552.1 TIGR04211 family SH3 domain-containing protein [Gammaproteobacteria bacterium]
MAAENRWVTDEFEVMMRSGTSTKERIVRQLKSGTRLEVLEIDAQSGYTKVRTASGTEGWVLTRYLRRSPTAQLLLPDLERKLKDSEAERTRLANELSELKKSRRALEREVGELQSANSSQEQQLDRITRLSSSTIEVDQQNTQLKQRVAEAEQQIEALEIENNQLASRANREWFLIGGAVLVAGLLLGLILPRIQWRKKSSWSDF